jgi:FkbH-like protein
MASKSGLSQWRIPKEIRFPIAAEVILRKRRALKRDLLQQTDLFPIKIAILGGSTTQEVRSILELFLLAQGIQPSFYESSHKAYYEEAAFDSPELREFKPKIVFVHTTWHNVSQFPGLLEPVERVGALVRREMERFENFWEKIHNDLGSTIIQNNFDLPRLRPLGNLEASEPSARTNFLLNLNSEFGRYAHTHSFLLLNDIFYLSAKMGLAQWCDHNYWYNYHMALSPAATVTVALNVANMVKALYGKSKKCIMLDLDNTLWGGAIGEDGLQNLALGPDHPCGAAYVDFQQYLKDLRKRGILLAVCSKNNPENAREAFSHPDMVLKLEDFSSFKANWNPKSDSVREIAVELGIGLDSLVFVDDDPVERAIVSAQVPEVAVPEIGSDVSLFAEILEHEGYFEPGNVVQDDIERTGYYDSNVRRSSHQATFETYGEFLDSLEMTAEIASFVPLYLQRITTLINRSNQFNLTTRRYTEAEVDAVSRDPNYITLYGRLSDKFGDNGLVSVVIGCARGDTIELDVWVMSCRVLKRDMEHAMFDALIEACLARGVQKIVGLYIPSKKNLGVKDHYAKLGFHQLESTATRSLWQYNLVEPYSAKARHICRRSGEASSTHK